MARTRMALAMAVEFLVGLGMMARARHVKEGFCQIPCRATIALRTAKRQPSEEWWRQHHPLIRSRQLDRLQGGVLRNLNFQPVSQGLFAVPWMVPMADDAQHQ